jgi:hypothetical protein
MAKVWIHQDGEPWPVQPKTTNSFGRFIKQLGLKESDWLEDMTDRGNLPAGVYVELDEGEATRYPDWDAGLYRSSASPKELDAISNPD